MNVAKFLLALILATSAVVEGYDVIAAKNIANRNLKVPGNSTTGHEKDANKRSFAPTIDAKCIDQTLLKIGRPAVDKKERTMREKQECAARENQERAAKEKQERDAKEKPVRAGKERHQKIASERQEHAETGRQEHVETRRQEHAEIGRQEHAETGRQEQIARVGHGTAAVTQKPEKRSKLIDYTKTAGKELAKVGALAVLIHQARPLFKNGNRDKIDHPPTDMINIIQPLSEQNATVVIAEGEQQNAIVAQGEKVEYNVEETKNGTETVVDAANQEEVQIVEGQGDANANAYETKIEETTIDTTNDTVTEESSTTEMIIDATTAANGNVENLETEGQQSDGENK